MRLDYTTSLLVIVGGWNPNMINDVWIRKNLLDSPNEQPNVNISGGISPTGIHTTTVDAVFSNVRLAILGERLELNLVNSNNFTYIENCVRKLCNSQPNTLVSGYGVNFTYITQSISNDLMNIFSHDTLSQHAFLQTHTYNGVNLDGIVTNMSIEINKANNKSGINFNFHFNIDALATLIQHMAEYSINSLKEKAVEFASSQYGLRLEN
jgi:hypothetical protein